MNENVYKDKNKNKTATMIDIAREAGVSIATVSRYINNETFVGEKKAQMIRAAIEKFDYMPNRYARGLKISRSMQIMLIVPDIKNPYYAKMYDVVQSLAHERKYVVILYNTNEEKTGELKAISLVSELNCDGIIFCSVSDDEKIINRLKNLGKPVVASTTFGKRIFDTVHGIKSGQGVYIATSHLIKNGHRKIAYAGGNPNSILNTRRLSGYKRALEEANIPIRSQYINSFSFNLEGGYLAGEHFCSLKDRPTAIACANDMIAIGCMQYFNRVGVNVPDDISIVGMDNIAMSEIVKPSLTTVNNDSAEFAQKAVGLLFDRISGDYDGEARESFCDRILIERNSVRKLV